jgi:hypothetical protein
MSNLVCSVTDWSCGLACVESILADNGVEKPQAEIITQLKGLFPKWIEEPGGLLPVDFETVFRELGFPVNVVEPDTYGDVIPKFGEKNTIGAIICVTKFWDVSGTELTDLNHSLRLLKADTTGVAVMNPCRCPFRARLEQYSWKQVVSFQGAVLIFKK